jgi:hypothetical protein
LAELFLARGVRLLYVRPVLCGADEALKVPTDEVEGDGDTAGGGAVAGWTVS